MTSSTEDDISVMEVENSINISKTTRCIKQKQDVPLNMVVKRQTSISKSGQKVYTAYKSFFSGILLQHILKAYESFIFLIQICP